MKILICDDTKSDLDVTYLYVTEYFKKRNQQVNIDCFNDCTPVINSLDFLENNTYDLYFLDIVMQYNGIDVAKAILSKNPNATMIFTTTSKEFAIDAIKIQAFDYILKPLDKADFFEAIDRVYKKVNMPKNFWTIKTNDLSIVTINIEDIIYIESNNRRYVVHLEDENITSTSIRTNFLDAIPFKIEEKSFLLCHNSYIVNMNKIKAIKELEFRMSNNELVPISKRMLKEVKDKYINYLMEGFNENN